MKHWPLLIVVPAVLFSPIFTYLLIDAFTPRAQAQKVEFYPKSEVQTDPYMDQRFCGIPQRDSYGNIKRSEKVLNSFRRIHPCPATGKEIGSCKGWAIDHVIPLACGGCDAVSNLQWLPNEIKSCKGKLCKDRFERKINCHPRQVIE